MTLENSSILIENINSLAEKLKPCQQLKSSIKEIEDLSIIRSQIEQLMSATKTIRDLYSDFVDRDYELENPFPENRKDTKENFKHDFSHIHTLVENCLIAGNSDLLQKWLIQPLKEGKKILALPELNPYIERLQVHSKDPQASQRARLYYEMVKNALESISR